MFSFLRFKGTLSQIRHAAYPIVCFPVLVRTFFLRKGFVSMLTWYCICVHHWHIENSLKTALAVGLYAKGGQRYKKYIIYESPPPQLFAIGKNPHTDE